MITVLFSCPECGLVDEKCKVRSRRNGEHVSHWFENALIFSLAIRHQTLSPKCMAGRVSDVKIPLGDNNSVGGQTDMVPPEGTPKRVRPL